MRKSKAYVDAYTLQCPYCSTLLSEPEGGSLMFEHNRGVPETLKCYGCDKVSAVPKTIPTAKIIINKEVVK